jgi:phage I-like protein
MRISALGGNFAFFTPISDSNALAFDAAGSRKPVWILGNAAGEYFNQNHGEVTITNEDIEQQFENFKSGAYPPKPQELPIDFEHLSVKAGRKPGDGIAAGWIQDVELRENTEKDRKELWVLVDWNDDAAELIKKKKYKGFSPVFHPNWKYHGKKELGSTLLGGALTNYQTIPDCVVTCSLNPSAEGGVGTALASVTQLPYSERERRIREAIEARYPLTVGRDGATDYSQWVYVRDVYEDRVIFSRGSKTYEQAYSYNDDLSVTFDGDPTEVIVEYSPIAATNEGDTEMKVFKFKNAKGEDVEIPASSLGAISLDSLAEVNPAVKEAVAKIPGAGAKVVPVTEFDTLNTTLQTLSSEVTRLSQTTEAQAAELKAARERVRDSEIDSLIGTGKVLPADRDFLVELANTAPAMFEKRIAALKTAEPVIKLDQSHGRDGNAPNGGAVVMFDQKITDERTADPKIDTAEAIKRAAAKFPELAKARNVALSMPIGVGGVALSTH